jgi:hypothetical protein
MDISQLIGDGQARLLALANGEASQSEVVRLVVTFLIGYIALTTLWRIRQIHPLAIFDKVRMYATAALFCACSTDKKVPKRKKAEADLTASGYDASKVTSVKKKTLIFIRHGESTWNDTFNKSKMPWYFLPRIVYACLYELSLLFVKDSWFFDSPLSPEGIEEALVLRKIINTDTHAMAKILAGEGADAAKSIVVSSPLRRAVSTVAIALHDRLAKRKEKVTLLSSLQEVSFNPDTLCLASKGKGPVPSWILKEATEAELGGVDAVKMYTEHMDASAYAGQKELRPKTGGLKRIQQFAKWCFAKEQEGKETIIVGGHSLYFKYFFKQCVLVPRSLSRRPLVLCASVPQWLTAPLRFAPLPPLATHSSGTSWTAPLTTSLSLTRCTTAPRWSSSLRS